MADVHDLAPFYALGALSDQDAERFQAHLPSCAECRAELAEFDLGVGALAQSAAEPAPASMKAEVMGRIDRAGRDDIDEDATVIPLFRRAAPWIAAAAAVAALVFVIGLGPATEQERIEAILASEDAVSVVVDADIVVFAEIVYTGSGDAVFSATGLSDVPATETYQLWLIGDEGPVSAGVFHPDAEGGALVLLDGRVEPGLVLGLTVEPSGGSEAPTGDILIAQEV